MKLFGKNAEKEGLVVLGPEMEPGHFLNPEPVASQAKHFEVNDGGLGAMAVSVARAIEREMPSIHARIEAEVSYAVQHFDYAGEIAKTVNLIMANALQNEVTDHARKALQDVDLQELIGTAIRAEVGKLLDSRRR